MKTIHLQVFGLPWGTDQPTLLALDHMLRDLTAEVDRISREQIHVHLVAGLLNSTPLALRLIVEMPGCPAESAPVITELYAESLADFAGRRLTDCLSVEVTLHSQDLEPTVIWVPDISQPQWPIRLWEPDRLNHPLAHYLLDLDLVRVCAYDMATADTAVIMRIVKLVVRAALAAKSDDAPQTLPGYFQRVRLERVGSKDVIWAYDFVVIMSDGLARAALQGWRPRIFTDENEALAIKLCQILLARFGHKLRNLPRPLDI